MVKAALRLGANDFISKPFDHELLMEKVASILNVANS
jgi:FixJ family two-component response regulator